MARHSDKRDRLIAAADGLFRKNGFERSTITDVAAAADVPAGNVYYYFKSKDDMLAAVVAARNARFTALLAGMQDAAPLHSLMHFIDMYEDNRKAIAHAGCGVGGLCQEGNRIGGPAAALAASSLQLMLIWLEARFAELGDAPKAARAQAAQLFGGLQGASLLAHTLNEPKILKTEARRLKAWLQERAEGTPAAEMP